MRCSVDASDTAAGAGGGVEVIAAVYRDAPVTGSHDTYTLASARHSTSRLRGAGPGRAAVAHSVYGPVSPGLVALALTLAVSTDLGTPMRYLAVETGFVRLRSTLPRLIALYWTSYFASSAAGCHEHST
ncbi:MAG: hypothetical protein KTV68_17055 [Acidimicrobiia bacterium]|nr:hypothetical protein [Acidimicrobiia bacterium]MCY4432952.1 hypothetical protein [bacterium]